MTSNFYRLCVVLSVALICLVSCVATLISFEVPGQVMPGGYFAVTIRGSHVAGTGGSEAAAIVQLPDGFQVVQAWDSATDNMLNWNDPRVLGLYKVETGHSLWSFSGSTSSSSTSAPTKVTLRLLIRAPLRGGIFKVKLALAGEEQAGWQAQSPTSQSDFSKIIAATHAKNLIISSPNPSTSFRPVYNGAPFIEKSAWRQVDFGDVNHDGRDDMICVSRLGSGPRVFLARGNGWVESSAGLWTGSGYGDALFGHFSPDNNLDIICSNGQIFLGDGKGSWMLSPLWIKLGHSVEGMSVADVNHDGKDDLVFGGYQAGVLRCFLQNSPGVFTESSNGLPNNTSVTDGGHEVLVHDVTGDGHLDIVWTWIYKTDVWAGDGKGNWTALNAAFPASEFWGVTAGDLDGDGNDEIIFSSIRQSPTVNMGGGVKVYYRKSPGVFAELTNTKLPTNVMARGLVTADFNGDGFLDLAAGVELPGNNGYGIQMVYGDGKGSFTSATNTGLPQLGHPEVDCLATGDMDGDGWPDLAVAFNGEGILAYHNYETGFHVFGSACKGKLTKAPKIGFSGSHAPGSTNATWTLGNAPAQAAYMFVLGKSNAFMAGMPILPFALGGIGAPGCTLYVDIFIPIFGVCDLAGAGSVPLPIPNDPMLHRLSLFGQFLVVAPGANQANLVVTQPAGLRLK